MSNTAARVGTADVLMDTALRLLNDLRVVDQHIDDNEKAGYGCPVESLEKAGQLAGEIRNLVRAAGYLADFTMDDVEHDAEVLRRLDADTLDGWPYSPAAYMVRAARDLVFAAAV